MIQEYLIPLIACGGAAILAYIIMKQQQQSYKPLESSPVEIKSTKKQTKAKTKKQPNAKPKPATVDSDPEPVEDEPVVVDEPAKKKKSGAAKKREREAKKKAEAEAAVVAAAPVAKKKNKKAAAAASPVKVVVPDENEWVSVDNKTPEKVSTPVVAAPKQKAKQSKKQKADMKQQQKNDMYKNLPEEVLAQLEKFNKLDRAAHGIPPAEQTVTTPVKSNSAEPEWEEIAEPKKKERKEKKSDDNSTGDAIVAAKPERVARVDPEKVFMKSETKWTGAEGNTKFYGLDDSSW